MNEIIYEFFLYEISGFFISQIILYGFNFNRNSNREKFKNLKF